MPDHIRLFQTERAWSQIRNEVYDLVDMWHGEGIAQNGEPAYRLESILIGMFDREYAITTASCTDALVLALKALDLPQNASVAVSNYTFSASAHAIARAGYRVLPVDVLEDYTIDVNQIPRDVDAVVAVDIFGNMSDWEGLLNLGVPIINDAAQSLESFNGALPSPKYGIMSCVSFSPSKTISAWGSGGAVLTDDPVLAEQVRKLRLHGKNKNADQAIDPGMNSMMSTMECACVITGLKYKDEWQARREAIAEYITANSQYETGIEYLPKHTLHKLVFQAEDRTLMNKQLFKQGIDSAYHYSLLINDERLYLTNRPFPVSDRLKKISFTVPNQHTLSDDEVERIAKALR